MERIIRIRGENVSLKIYSYFKISLLDLQHLKQQLSNHIIQLVNTQVLIRAKALQLDRRKNIWKKVTQSAKFFAVFWHKKLQPLVSNFYSWFYMKKVTQLLTNLALLAVNLALFLK
eukprot:SAG11_NODE_14468_length_610_cov_59.383562_1_plen_115_part_01